MTEDALERYIEKNFEARWIEMAKRKIEDAKKEIEDTEKEMEAVQTRWKNF